MTVDSQPEGMFSWISLGPSQESYGPQVAVVTLNNPKNRNALSLQWIDAVCQLLDSPQPSNGWPLGVCFMGGELSVWSSGVDIDSFIVGEDPMGPMTGIERLIRSTQNAMVLTMACISGSVWGGAVDWALSCDVVWVDPHSTFYLTPAKLGLAYSTSGISRLKRAIPSQSLMYHLSTAEPILGSSLIQWGAAQPWVPTPGTVLSRQSMIEAMGPIWSKMSQMSPACLRLFKKQIQHTVPESLESIRASIYQGSTFQEGLAAFHQKRTPQWPDLS